MMIFRISANWFPYLLLMLLLLVLHGLPEHLHLILEYQRNAIANGQWWRLITGHLLHSNLWHLLLNLAGLALVMLLHSTYYPHRRLLVWQLLFSALLISCALYYAAPQISAYVGLSGILHALLVWGACQDITHKVRGGWLLLAGIIAKVGYEQWHGPDAELTRLIAAEVAIDAHLFGVIAGLLLAVMTKIVRQYAN